MNDPQFWSDLEKRFRELPDPSGSLRADADYIVGSGRRDWKLTGSGYSLRVRFEALAIEAGAALEEYSANDPLTSWLELLFSLHPDSELGAHSVERNRDGTQGLEHLQYKIARVCEASADQCAVLQGNARVAAGRRSAQEKGGLPAFPVFDEGDGCKRFAEFVPSEDALVLERLHIRLAADISHEPDKRERFICNAVQECFDILVESTRRRGGNFNEHILGLDLPAKTLRFAHEAGWLPESAKPDAQHWRDWAKELLRDRYSRVGLEWRGISDPCPFKFVPFPRDSSFQKPEPPINSANSSTVVLTDPSVITAESAIAGRPYGDVLPEESRAFIQAAEAEAEAYRLERFNEANRLFSEALRKNEGYLNLDIGGVRFAKQEAASLYRDGRTCATLHYLDAMAEAHLKTMSPNVERFLQSLEDLAEKASKRFGGDSEAIEIRKKEWEAEAWRRVAARATRAEQTEDALPGSVNRERNSQPAGAAPGNAERAIAILKDRPRTPAADPDIMDPQTLKLEPMFTARASWLKARLLERGWGTSDPYKHRGPDRKTIERICRGQAVRNDVLTKLADALSMEGGKINVLDIPQN